MTGRAIYAAGPATKRPAILEHAAFRVGSDRFLYIGADTIERRVSTSQLKGQLERSIEGEG